MTLMGIGENDLITTVSNYCYRAPAVPNASRCPVIHHDIVIRMPWLSICRSL